MCICAVVLSGRHHWCPLVFVHNRDEAFDRETGAVEDEGSLICGRDLVSGGTWMGLNKENGVLAMLTNFRSRLYPLPSSPQTRGRIITTLLDGKPHNLGDMREYQGFNAVWTNVKCPDHLYYVSNRPYRPGQKVNRDGCCRLKLGQGAYAVSNGHFNDDTWPKVTFLREKVQEIVHAHPPPTGADAASELAAMRSLADHLGDVLSHRERFDTLPDTSFSPVPDREPQIQCVFVDHERGVTKPPLHNFGTRLQCVVLRGHHAVYYFTRSTDAFPHIEPWSLHIVPGQLDRGRVKQSVRRITMAAAAFAGIAAMIIGRP